MLLSKEKINREKSQSLPEKMLPRKVCPEKNGKQKYSREKNTVHPMYVLYTNRLAAKWNLSLHCDKTE